MAKSFSNGRNFGTHVEVMVDGKKKILTPKEFKKLREEWLKKKVTKKWSENVRAEQDGEGIVKTEKPEKKKAKNE
jgi:hypothetical protein